MNYDQIRQRVDLHRAGIIAFARRLVQVPSMPGEESGVAALIRAEMERLRYDRVWVDEVGNVVGCIRGTDGPSQMLNGHMDHVDAGDRERWPHPPHGGEIHDGELWGRGAVDMKGALAAMVWAGGLLQMMGTLPRGDLYVSTVVQEEVGGLGARHLARALPVDRVVVGEASGNHLRRGHRGRVELDASFVGRSVHAAMPQLGVNPHFSMARFLAGLRAMDMLVDPDYGASSVAPTRVVSEPESANVTPGILRLALDWRNIPGEEPGEVVAKLQALLDSSLEAGCEGSVEIATKALVTYTGAEMAYPDTFPSFTTAKDHPWLAEARGVLEKALGRPVEVGTWRFATDGGHFAASGATVLGFGPGNDAVVHTMDERLRIDGLLESVVGYLALALG